jgi:hypothetical protein
VRLLHLLVDPHPLAAHLGHDLSGLSVLELVELVPFAASAFGLLLLALLLLLHDDLVADDLLHDDVVEDVAQQLVLHLKRFEYTHKGMIREL